MKEKLRHIPPVHELQKHPKLVELQDEHHLSLQMITGWIQNILQQIRSDILQDKLHAKTSKELEDLVIQQVTVKAKKWLTPNITRVINGTGTILHTNLGRARLSKDAIKHVSEVAANYSNLEYNLDTGTRGSRHAIIEELIKEVTGAESALVVNNNAAAVYLVLRAFARGREVIVSRGELVEIGGSFRVSSIMEESDARLIEVGTTNKTHLFDYEQAITEQTAMILKVHSSNFKIVGFTKEVSRKELVTLSKKQNLIFYEDLGSGALFDFKQQGIGEEPVVRHVLKEGADVVSFSGDKLLGGPQAGIIAGKKAFIDQLKKHQLARVLRVDKMTLAALEITLKEYAKKSYNIPAICDILTPLHEIKRRAEKFMEKTSHLHHFKMELKNHYSKIGGGTMPLEELETCGVIIQSDISSSKLERLLRTQSPPVVGRFVEDQLFLDFRTITGEEVDMLADILLELDQQL